MKSPVFILLSDSARVDSNASCLELHIQRRNIVSTILVHGEPLTSPLREITHVKHHHRVGTRWGWSRCHCINHGRTWRSEFAHQGQGVGDWGVRRRGVALGTHRRCGLARQRLPRVALECRQSGKGGTLGGRLREPRGAPGGGQDRRHGAVRPIAQRQGPRCRHRDLREGESRQEPARRRRPRLRGRSCHQEYRLGSPPWTRCSRANAPSVRLCTMWGATLGELSKPRYCWPRSRWVTTCTRRPTRRLAQRTSWSAVSFSDTWQLGSRCSASCAGWKRCSRPGWPRLS